MIQKIFKTTGIIMGLSLLVFLNACSPSTKDPDETKTDSAEAETKTIPNSFNPDSAYAYVQKQVDFGPRVPNTASHVNCGNWLTQKLKEWSDTVYVQNFTAKNYKGVKWNGKNIIGTFNPKSKDRLLLCAHWDTRPQADQDLMSPDKPSDGASDGASGVGILLEIARQLHIQKPSIGIDIIFFDLEDGGSNGGSDETETWCLGSQHWGKNTHIKDYKANNGILLDMVGAKNAVFAREGMSERFDNLFLSRVWQTGAALGFGSYFINYTRSAITDDHVYVSYEANVPTIDIIEYDQNTTSGFGSYWHTLNDNMSIIDKATLNAVGKTVLHVALNPSIFIKKSANSGS